MAIFIYKALDQEGKVVRGKTSSRSESELHSKLGQSGLDLISAEEMKSAGVNIFTKVSLRELILICVHLYQLESAGVPILDSVGELRDSTESNAIRNVMMDVYDSLKNGTLLSASLAQHPKVFDKVFCSLVAAGEKTGNFAEIFKHLEKHLKWTQEIRSKISKATYYPLFLFILMSTVVMVMMIFVIPKLTAFLLAQNIALPWYTVALIATSGFVVNYWYIVLSIPIITYFALKILCWNSVAFSYAVDSILLKIPVYGKILRKFELARFCHFFSMTYKSGMGVLECLDIAGNVVRNLVIREAIDNARNSVSDGQKLTDSLRSAGHFPSLVIRMFKVGEDSGNLDKSLEEVNHFYDTEVNDAVNAFVAFLQPALTMVMGGLLMWITLSVFAPIYGSFNVKR